MTMHSSDTVTTLNLKATTQEGHSGAEFEIIHDLSQPGMVTIRFVKEGQVWTAPVSFEEIAFFQAEAYATEGLAGIEESDARH